MEVVLVTGGSGLVGNAIRNEINNSINSYYSENYSFVFSNSSKCNLCDYDSTLEYFKKIQPNYVIHLAANVGGLYKNMNKKVEMLEDNLLININVLKCCKIINVKKLINCLSTCIFPDNVEYPITEDKLHEGPPHWSNDSYAYAKRLLEVQSNAYNTQYNTNFICIIPTNIYGQYDNYNLEDSHVIPGLIHKFYIAKKNNENVVIRGSGLPRRQFIYSIDLAKLILEILKKYNNNNNIILSPTEEVSIKEIALIIADTINFEGQILYDMSYSDGQYKKTIDNKKLMKFLPDFKFTPLDIGIKESVDWFIENYENIRK